MGNFLEIAIIKNCSEQKAKLVVEEISNSKEIKYLDYTKCMYNEKNDGISIFFDGVGGYQDLAKLLSLKLDTSVMLAYIYDGDYWGYYFYEKGIEIDCFNKLPDYFEDEEIDKEKYRGNASIIAKHFNVNEEDIVNYLKFIEIDDFYDDDFCNSGEKAYEDDEFEIYDAWQMTDFINKLGFLCEFKE